MADLGDLARAVPGRVRAPLAAGVLAAAVTLVGIAVRIGLLPLPLLGNTLVGAGDNGDAYRLFCTAGLTPATPDGFSLWRGVVVTAFTTGGEPCTAAPSSAAALLGLVAGSAPGGIFSLTSYAWLFAGLAALGVGVGAATLAAVRPARALLVALPLAPLLVVPWWSRFLVSLYAEPTALVAALWVVVGLLVVAGTRPADRSARLVALGLVALGGFVGATAKPGFLPVGLVAAGCCALVVVRSRSVPDDDRPRRSRAVRVGWRLVGPLVAVGLVAGAAWPVAQLVEGQSTAYARVNAHNLIFTALAPEIGPATVMPAVGLPMSAAGRSGEGYYVAGGYGIPGWDRAIALRPEEATSAARALLAEHPGALATMIGHGLTASMRPQLGYLPSAPWGTAPVRFEGRTVYPEAGPWTGLTHQWLDGVAGGWLPAALVAVALGAAAATALPRARRRADPLTTGLVRVAGASALLGLGIVTLAVVGDGYYELSKHVWLASYAFAVTALVGAVAAGRAATARFRRASPL